MSQYEDNEIYFSGSFERGTFKLFEKLEIFM